MKKLRAGIVGLGVGERHIYGYHRHPACVVTRACDFTDQKLAEVSARHPGIAFSKNADDVLKDPEIDVVSIASYDNFHCEQILTALAHDKHVFVEKPIVMSTDEARQVRRALVAKPHLKLSSNLILRRCPRFISLRERIRAGRLGDLYFIESDYKFGRLHKIVDGWRSEIPYYSALYGGGIHVVDLMMWLTGASVEEVSAYGNQIASKGSKFRFNDFSVGMLRFSNGMLGKVSANLGCVHPHFHSLWVYGTQATFSNEQNHGIFFTSRDRDAAPELMREDYPGAEKGDLIYDFVESILGRVSSGVSTEDVFKSISVCFSLEEAMVSREKVPVRYL